ncbi:MAG: hypothetical protein B7Y99_06840 [Caulobacterales bacterium 32-69-10]|nr:MAG: hypothetical protein B7Y99_06840 [Caulobacterales bacterium 32-69-10]
MKSLLAAAAMTLAFAGYAQAQSVTATLSTPIAKPRQIVLESTVWQCKESECRALTGSESGSWQACKALARVFGQVSAYSTLDEAKLARCNASAKK